MLLLIIVKFMLMVLAAIFACATVMVSIALMVLLFMVGVSANNTITNSGYNNTD